MADNNCKILAKTFEAPIKATFAYLVLYFVFLYFQAGVGHVQFYLAKKKAQSDAKEKGEKVEKVSYGKIKYGQSNDKLSLTALRTVGNLMEQAIPFLTSLWLHAVFVSPEGAANVAWIYIITRSYYPIAFYLGMPYILFSTLPGYGCIFYLLCIQIGCLISFNKLNKSTNLQHDIVTILDIAVS